MPEPSPSGVGRAHRPEALDLCEKLQKMVGYVPVGTFDLLNVLAHPDVIEQTRHFLDACERDDPTPQSEHSSAVPDE